MIKSKSPDLRFVKILNTHTHYIYFLKLNSFELQLKNWLEIKYFYSLKIVKDIWNSYIFLIIFIA